MEIVKKKLGNGIGRAEVYRHLSKKHPEGLKVHIDYLHDLMKSLYKETNASSLKVDGIEELFSEARSTLRNLRRDLAILANQMQKEDSPPLAAMLSRTTLHMSENIQGVKVEKSSPTFEIPLFGGNVLEYRDFIGAFLDTVGRDDSLTNLEKLIRLKSYLKGEAFDFVNEVPTSANNYPLTLKLLEDLYDNEKQCIVKLGKRLEALPRVSMEDASKFRKIFWKLESILLAMEEYGVKVNEESFLRLLYQQKFSEEILHAAMLKNPEMSFDELREEIRHIVRELETCNKSKPETDTSVNYSLSDDETPDVMSCNQENNSSNAASKENAFAEFDNACIFCGEDHWAAVCSKYPTVEERQKLIVGRCGRCLCSKHPKKTCPTKIVCIYCDQNSHNSALCSIRFRDSSWLTEAASKKSSPSVSGNSDAEAIMEITLLTVCTTIAYPKSYAKTTVRLILLNTPPVSLLAESAANRLGIEVPRERTLRLRSIFSNRSFEASAEAFTLLIHVKDGPPEPIEVHIVEDGLDGGNLPAVTIKDFKKVHPNLSYIDLPDPGNGRPVELFLGHHHFLKYYIGGEAGRVIDVKKNWTLKASRFGWLAGGNVKTNYPIGSLSYVYDDTILK